MNDSSNGPCCNSPFTVHAFADNELDAKDWLAFEEHLSTCPDCSAAYRQILALRALFKHSLLRYRAPQKLRREIASALEVRDRMALGRAPGATAWPAAPLSRPDSIWKKWKRIDRTASAFAASLAVAAALLLSPGGPALEDEIIGKYQRSLAVSLPPEGASATFREERQRPKGRMDFLTPIPDLAGSGFTYQGARTDRIAGHRAAVLIYTYGSSAVDLFIWPSGAEPPGALSKQGYNIVHWTRSGLKFCAISTLAAAELSRFQEAFASKLPA
jgi:anti-sigma factor RsiW